MTDDIESGIAKWRQIADRLEAEIGAGILDRRLPSEAALAERFAANRHTVRRAIGALTTRGLLRAERGRGTFVNGEKTGRLAYPIGSKPRFSENVGAAAKEPGGRLIANTKVKASLEQAEQLACRPGEPLLRLEMLRVADGVPVLVTTKWFVEARFGGIVAAYVETGTITEALARCGVSSYRRASTRVRAALADPGDAELLQCPAGAPVLVTESIDAYAEGHPIQTAITRFRADSVELVFEPSANDR